MKEVIMKTLEVMVPVLVAVITVYGSVTVAKLDRLQKSIKTNHGSKNIGHAIDNLSEKVDLLATNQEQIASTMNLMHTADIAIKSRLDALEVIQSSLSTAVNACPSHTQHPRKD